MRVGFLGAGLIATFHSKMLRASGEAFERAGVYDPDRARAEEFVARAGGGSFVCDTEDGVLDSCDAVYICTWTSEHPRLVEAAAERRLAVFCEKPLATTLDGARHMADVVEAAGVANQVGLILRRSPAFNLLREIVSDPANGRLMSVVFRDDQFIPVRGHYGSTWRGDVDKAGAGTLLEHSIHDVDMLEFVCGPIESVSARSADFHQIEGIEDVVSATLQFANGGLGVLTSVWHDVDPRGSLRRVEVFCERAYAVLEGDWFGPVRWTKADGSDGVLEGDALVEHVRSALHDELNPDGAFVRAVANGRPCSPDFREAVRAHEVTEAIYESARYNGAPRGCGSPG
ncbi:MAG TPA: Gfo/Idh/MocA family oxidoreductase [Acidimicrobiales bacterium]